jgi:hypothetical protein
MRSIAHSQQLTAATSCPSGYLSVPLCLLAPALLQPPAAAGRSSTLWRWLPAAAAALVMMLRIQSTHPCCSETCTIVTCLSSCCADSCNTQKQWPRQTGPARSLTGTLQLLRRPAENGEAEMLDYAIGGVSQPAITSYALSSAMACSALRSVTTPTVAASRSHSQLFCDKLRRCHLLTFNNERNPLGEMVTPAMLFEANETQGLQAD